MKLNVTVEIKELSNMRPSDIRQLPREVQDKLAKMPSAEHESKAILFVDSFPAKIIDTRSVHRYFPMLVARTFSEAVALLRDCDSLLMKRGPHCVRWTGHEFLDRGKTWSPTPNDILSDKKEWYVYSKDQSDQTQAELPQL